MAKITVRHACGHTERVEVGSGPAREKSARAFDASLENCPSCESAAEAHPCSGCHGRGCSECQYTGWA